MTPVRHAQDDEYQHLAPLFHQLADSSETESDRRRIRDRLVTGYQPLAEHIARRFRNRGQHDDDLTQVAMVGLIHAVDRFDPDRGSNFLAFAIPTITGEIRRYFRDATWGVRVPRRLKELHATVNNRAEEIAQQLGRSPRPSELAARMGLPVEEVYEGLQVGFAYRSESLDQSYEGDGGMGGARDCDLGVQDRDLAAVEVREALYPALSTLPEREASIVTMRFFGNLTQTQIAEKLGISQMHVSRLLSATLRTLRALLEDGEGPLT
ncbi:MAG TPA: SigB/SigF/SigG family RNA polymerase sigma factor [Pseudonocardiaceae bacterium]|jgi:RNA polymerase sigma-B factor|nr:SigB/SigF/SigG family RNA polymerase sigma factor [Pseudonocardiaceae bacterium]